MGEDRGAAVLGRGWVRVRQPALSTVSLSSVKRYARSVSEGEPLVPNKRDLTRSRSQASKSPHLAQQAALRAHRCLEEILPGGYGVGFIGSARADRAQCIRREPWKSRLKIGDRKCWNELPEEVGGL